MRSGECYMIRMARRGAIPSQCGVPSPSSPALPTARHSPPLQVGQKRGRTQFEGPIEAEAATAAKRIRTGQAAQQWITVHTRAQPMKQRYHYNVRDPVGFLPSPPSFLSALQNPVPATLCHH